MKTIGDVLAFVFDKDILNKALGQSKLQSEWDKIVEETFITSRKKKYNIVDNDVLFEEDRITAQKVACHSRIAYIKNNILFVEIDHQGWRQILQTVQKKLITLINKKYPDISLNSIAFLLVNDSKQEGQVKETKEKDVQELMVSPEKDNFCRNNSTESRYERIKDERLKKILKQLENRVNNI
jgi:hypothetical protein